MKVKQHQGIWLPDNDTHFAGHLDAGPKIDGAGTYQHAKLEMALKLFNKRVCAVDIGAHVGLWSRTLAREFETVIAFEPVPEHQECFKRNLHNPDRKSRVVLHPFALGAEHRDIYIDTVPDNSGNARVAENGSIANSVKVKMHRLDDYFFDNHGINFLKIDVEGWELDVLKGGKETIMRYKPVMVVEQKKGHGQRYGISDRAAVDLLLTWGFKEAWCRNGDYCMIWR